MADTEAIDLLYSQLGALPDPEFGVINLLPWAQESDDTNAIKRRVCEAIIRVFENGGYSLTKEKLPGPPSRSVQIRCRSCSKLLFSAAVDSTTGVSAVPASLTLSALAQLSPECPHDTVTLEDQRRRIEQAVLEADS